jgi:hypothetical protein
MKTEKITLTDRAPVQIIEKDWPLVATANDHDNQYEFQANQLWWIRVRQHNDGRTIVYAAYTAGPGGRMLGHRDKKTGELLLPESTHIPGELNDEGYSPYYAHPDIIQAIKRVGASAECNHLIDSCIADLPEEKLN